MGVSDARSCQCGVEGHMRMTLCFTEDSFFFSLFFFFFLGRAYNKYISVSTVKYLLSNEHVVSPSTILIIVSVLRLLWYWLFCVRDEEYRGICYFELVFLFFMKVLSEFMEVCMYVLVVLIGLEG